MKKAILFLIGIALYSTLSYAQLKTHQIVFDFTKADTASFSLVVRQLTNITNAAPDSRLEVVCYGPGVDLLVKSKTTVGKQIEELQSKYNVKFAACEFTMRRRGIDKSELLTQAVTVPLASLEISSRQQEGWSYIKVGY